MMNRSLKLFFRNIYRMKSFLQRKEQPCYMYSVLNQLQPWRSITDKAEADTQKETNDKPQNLLRSELEKGQNDSSLRRYRAEAEDLSDGKWRLELAWLTKALEPALQLCRWALPTEDAFGRKPSRSTRSLTEILSSIQRSKIGIQDWSFSDLTIGLYLIYLRQASIKPFDDIKGTQISSDSIVQDLIYHIELAKGAYKDNARVLARNCMLRESNVLKFVRSSSVMRPGYYIGVDTRKKLVLLGIRGTHTVYDLITDIVTASDEEVTFDGYSTHFGTAEAARWFLYHEMDTIRKCLEKYEVKAGGSFSWGSHSFFTRNNDPEKATKGVGF